MTITKLLPRGTFLAEVFTRSKKLLAGGVVCAALAAGLLFP